MDTMTAALLRERDELLARGLSERVKQVDEQLAIRGYELAADRKEVTAFGDAEPQYMDGGPRGRRSQPKRRAT